MALTSQGTSCYRATSTVSFMETDSVIDHPYSWRRAESTYAVSHTICCHIHRTACKQWQNNYVYVYIICHKITAAPSNKVNGSQGTCQGSTTDLMLTLMPVITLTAHRWYAKPAAAAPQQYITHAFSYCCTSIRCWARDIFAFGTGVSSPASAANRRILSTKVMRSGVI